MLNAVIIEDERAAADNLKNVLKDVVPDIHFAAVITSVEDGITYFSAMPKHDLIFCDINLTDGFSFDIFAGAPVHAPIIFTTAFDEFLMKAFDYNGIDYLLKPVNTQSITKAIAKYNSLQRHFTNHNNVLKLLDYIGSAGKKRIIVRKGAENIAVKNDDVALLYTDNKIVYLIDRLKTKYIYDDNLSALMEELDPTVFFRANRKYIVSINFIKSYKTFEKVKLLVELSVPDIQHQIIISQENAAAFKKWIAGI